MASNEISTLNQKTLTNQQSQFLRHFFETGDLNKSARFAGYELKVAGILAASMNDPNTSLGRVFQEMRQDLVRSTTITLEKKRCKLWDLVEWSTNTKDNGRPNDSKLALACIDMLNKMDGHYAALEINSKTQVQKEVVTFRQEIPKIDKVIEAHEVDLADVENG